ncbi:unnamed protein product [Linum tenue]|uniref:F-box domain-containing protein n=1 Tax=Linum tenue TaxID=586396 RepID=A0AAV0M5U2_9ROSI|nr:unnamed protein product [Linum tenue]
MCSDRLGHLPEHIIHHILSFRDTKSVVQTSVLLRAWRSAWKHVANIDLRSDSFEEYPSFRTFVSQVLSLRYKLNVQKLSYIDCGPLFCWGDERIFKISGPQLLSLKILDNLLNTKVEISAPKLEFFSFWNVLEIHELSKLSVPSLVLHADIKFASNELSATIIEWPTLIVIALFKGLSNATSLVLDSFSIQVICSLTLLQYRWLSS